MNDPEIIDITNTKINNIEEIHLNNKRPSVNFGSGIELLMNDKKNKTENKNNLSTDIDIRDINDLENELNTFTSQPKTNKVGLFSSLFDNKNINENENENKNININETIKIGKETSKDTIASENKTWDGFQKFNDISNEQEIKMNQSSVLKEELLRDKFKYLRKLEDLETKGIKLSKKYNMDSSLQEMQGEYQMLMDEKERTNSVKFQGKMLMALITGIEFLNNKVDPFDIKLDGWGEQVNENINDYDELFAELHDKYKSKAKMAPELKLLFQLGGSAIMVHMSNTMFKSSLPGMDDIMRQNPELMQQFTQAAVNSMGSSNPGFSGFMNNFVPKNNNQSSQPTQESVYRPNQQGFSNRPDLNIARADGININTQQAKAGGVEQSIKRPEMKGPKDIGDILSNLKTKTINIPSRNETEDNNNSTISIKDLEDINLTNMPKPKRRPKSEKNSISLDI